MTQIASIDYVNLRVHLHSDTVVNGLDSLAAYAEERELRRLNANGERNFLPILSAEGNEPKGSGKYTPRRAKLRPPARWVPYPTSHDLVLLTETIIASEGLTQQGCFDRSSLPPGVEVNIDNQAPQVEIIKVIQGSAVTAQDKTDIINGIAALGETFKDKNTEEEIHTWLDSYINKGDWKADSINLDAVLNAIGALNNLSLVDIENSVVLAKEASLTSIASAIAGLSVGETDLTPVLTAISNLNNVTPEEVRAAFDAADFKDKNTEAEIHTWLDSYPNKTDWKASSQDIVDLMWDEVV